jgi:hypothetical protein
MEQQDLFAALEAREAALARVGENSGGFMALGLAAIAELSGEYTGEDIRFALKQRGIEPHHHNAWGALTMAAIRRGLLVPTGHYTKMCDPKSNARKTQTYRTPQEGRTHE